MNSKLLVDKVQNRFDRRENVKKTIGEKSSCEDHERQTFSKDKFYVGFRLKNDKDFRREMVRTMVKSGSIQRW